MPVMKVEGVKIEVTPYKQYQFDYQQSDMETLYRRGDWHSWRDEIKWLEQNGEQDRKLTPGQTLALTEDLRSLDEARAPFTENPNQAYKLAHKNRAQNNRRFAREHAELVERARATR